MVEAAATFVVRIILSIRLMARAAELKPLRLIRYEQPSGRMESKNQCSKYSVYEPLARDLRRIQVSCCVVR